MQVHPNAAKNQVVSFSAGVLEVRVAAPPVKGKANKELIAFLGRLLGVSKINITILKGQTARHKIVAVKGLSQEEVMNRLSFSGEAPGR